MDTTDLFVVKYDFSGNGLWARSARGNGFDLSSGVDNDLSGNIFITGSYNGTNIIFENDTLYNSGINNTVDFFIIKYDQAGNLLWTKSQGGINFDGAEDICLDKNNNIIITGSYSSPFIPFWNDTIFNTGTTNTTDFFIIKYDSSGLPIWAKSAGGIDDDYAAGITTDSNGDIISSGYYNSPTCTFGSNVLTNSNAPYNDIFVGKLGGVTGIPEELYHYALFIYPNPSNGKLTVVLNEKEIEVEVFNIIGEKIYSVNLINSSSFILDISEKPNGIYFLRISTIGGSASGGKTKNGTAVKKLIKQ